MSEVTETAVPPRQPSAATRRAGLAGVALAILAALAPTGEAVAQTWQKPPPVRLERSGPIRVLKPPVGAAKPVPVGIGERRPAGVERRPPVLRAGPPGRRPGGGGLGVGGAIGVGVGIGLIGAAAASRASAGEPPPPPPPPPARQPPQRRPPAAATAAPVPAIRVPPASETRFVPGEVLIEMRGGRPIAPLAGRLGLDVIASRTSLLAGATLHRLRARDGRTTTPMILARLQREPTVAAAQPNWVYTLQQAATALDPAPAEAVAPSATSPTTEAPATEPAAAVATPTEPPPTVAAPTGTPPVQPTAAGDPSTAPAPAEAAAASPPGEAPAVTTATPPVTPAPAETAAAPVAAEAPAVPAAPETPAAPPVVEAPAVVVTAPAAAPAATETPTAPPPAAPPTVTAATPPASPAPVAAPAAAPPPAPPVLTAATPAAPVAPSPLPGQYAADKLHLVAAHDRARGRDVRIAVIDTGADPSHPELAGAVEASFDALEGVDRTPGSHGTAMAGAIAARLRLAGTAPAARLLLARAFGPPAANGVAQGSTWHVVACLDWAVAHDARIVSMSFAGPSSAILTRALAAARDKGVVAVAAAGNAGPQSPPLFPAADPTVVAVTASDPDDRILPAAVRGGHVLVTAPGVDILVAAPQGGYDLTSGTSVAAAEVSGIVALLLEKRPDLGPDDIRRTLAATAIDLGPKGRDPIFGAGLVDAEAALAAVATPSR